jgi:hypothetical protein
MKDQLELIDLGKFTSEESRMIATALQMRALHLAERDPQDYRDDYEIKSTDYNQLRRKVEFRAGVSLVPWGCHVFLPAISGENGTQPVS